MQLCGPLNPDIQFLKIGLTPQRVIEKDSYKLARIALHVIYIHFMETEGFFLCSQKPITGLYPQSNYSWQSWSKLDTNCSPTLYFQRCNTVQRNILLQGRFIVHCILLNMHHIKSGFGVSILKIYFVSKQMCCT